MVTGCHFNKELITTNKQILNRSHKTDSLEHLVFLVEKHKHRKCLFQEKNRTLTIKQGMNAGLDSLG